MTRQEIYGQLTLKAKKLAKELDIQLWVIDFGTSLRFHIDGEWIGWWGGQKDVSLYRKQPSQKSINTCIKEAEEWFNTLPERMNDYKKWVNSDRLELAKEVNRRFQQTWNTKKVHDFLKEEMKK